METVLEVTSNGPYIKAPTWCQYQADGSVHSSICSLCKICAFTVTQSDTMRMSKEEINKFLNFLTEHNKVVSSSIFSQHQYLLKKHRVVLCILLSPGLFAQALSFVYSTDTQKKNYIFSYYVNTGNPICSMLGAPVYLSRKLTESLVQVVGEVTWT